MFQINLMQDAFLMLGSFLYGILVILFGVGLQKGLQKDSGFTRKIIHIFAGFSAFVTFFFSPAFSWFAIIIGCSFKILLYTARSRGPLKNVFESMAREEDRNSGSLLGPVYYAISLTILTTIFTLPFLPQLLQYYWIPACCLAMMFIGDGIAPIIGKKWGFLAADEILDKSRQQELHSWNPAS